MDDDLKNNKNHKTSSSESIKSIDLKTIAKNNQNQKDLG